MAIIGLRSTNDFTVDGQRPKNWREGILYLDPNGSSPITALTSMMGERSVDDPEFNWYERELTDRRFKLGANMTLAGTTLTLVTPAVGTSRSALELKQNDVLLVEESSEKLRVTADPTSATSVEVERGFGGTTAATVDYDGAAVNPYLLAIGSSFEEGSLSPSGVQLDPVKRYNLTQIFRTPLEFTRTAVNTRLRTGDQVQQAKKDALQMLSMDAERAYIFGTRWEGTRNGRPVRTFGGIEWFLTQYASDNILTASATTNMTSFEDYLRQLFEYGSEQKMAFCGNRALLAIQQIVRKNASYNIYNGEKEYGMNVTKVTCPFGELVLKRHTLFNNNRSSTATAQAYSAMDRWALVLDMSNLKHVYLKNSDIKYHADIQANDLDGMKSEYMGEFSLQVTHPKTHGIIKNLTAGVADS